MSDLIIKNVRGGTVESVHQVSVAVSDAEGKLLAYAGRPDRVTFMRSAAKPFQAIPLVEDGALQQLGLGSRELALVCASHNSEQAHVELARRFLERIGCTESDLACGPHRPLWHEFAVLAPDGHDFVELPMAPIASNCSGKHAGMLALAKFHGWETAGYHERGHPVQNRMKLPVARLACVAQDDIREGTDGCGVVTFAVPLSSMARAYAQLVTTDGSAPRAVVSAMLTHPELVAGTGRLCTELMRGYDGRVLAKVGAQGVYGAALIDRGIGIALKVEDGDNLAAIVALVAVLDQLGIDPPASALLPGAAQLVLRNTRNEPVGTMRAAGRLAFD
jgi:L-asparaginase II